MCMTNYDKPATMAIFYCDNCDRCVASYHTTTFTKMCNCENEMRPILVTNDYELFRTKEQEIVDERKNTPGYQRGYKAGYETGYAAKFTADFKQGILEYLKMNPLSLVDYTQLTLEAAKPKNEWQKVSFYVKIQ